MTQPAFDAADNPTLAPDGHWAAGLKWYLAQGIDNLAQDAGLPDGRALIEKASGRGPVSITDDTQLRAWFEECFVFVHPGQASYWEAAVHCSIGIHSLDAGIFPRVAISGGRGI